jgi:aconitate hydratase
VKIAKSFARIHRANLINFGILPLVFADPSDHGKIEQGDSICFKNLKQMVAAEDEITGVIKGRELAVRFTLALSQRERSYILEGGLLNYIRKKEGK